MYIWPRADLRPGDRVLDPIDYPDHHEVLTVGDMTEVRHCESGGLRFFAPGVLLAVAHRTDLRDRAAEGFSDISPDWQGSTAEEQRIVQRVLKFEGTSKAITEFDRKCSRLGDYWYWFTLGTLWVNYTGWSALPTWKRLFGSERPGRASSLMKPSELRILQALPDELTLYRAHRPGEQDWIAYTLNPQTAARFARERGVDRVSVYLCPKDRVLALFLRRDEDEVLVLDKQDATFLQEQKVVIV